MNKESSKNETALSSAESRAKQSSKLLNVITVGVIVAVGFILAVSNPSKESFDSYLEKRMEEVAANEDLGIIEKMAGKVMGIQAELTGSYKSYFFFSTVDAKFGQEDYTYIGIVGNWFILSEPMSK